ncbi:MAG: flavodoxin family protein [Candidatus Diapherotrites archaeon]|nr:flavodoxin family protein [Candidatus Diapherotrites archaeon]
MKVLAVCGSPRQGNTEAMLRRVLDGAKDAGAQIELVLLRNKRVEPCKAICDCFEKGLPCTIDDDMAQVISKMLVADAIVLGSPNYFKNVSGIMKNFMDRTNPIVGKARLKGKKAAVVCVGSQSMENIAFCARALEEFAKDHQMLLVGAVKAKAEKPKEVQKNKKIRQECFELGKILSAK